MGQIYSYVYQLLNSIAYTIVFALLWPNLGQGYYTEVCKPSK